MHFLSRALAAGVSLTLALAMLALPLRPAHAGTAVSAVYQIAATFDAAVFVNGIPAAPGDTYGDGDVVEIDAAADGYVVLNRTDSTSSTTWTHYGSVTSMTFQAIWIGDD